MTSRSIIILGAFATLIVLGFLSQRWRVTFFNYKKAVPKGCKSNTESSMQCEEYMVHWHYAEPAQYEALIDLFSQRIIHENSLLRVDTVREVESNSQFSTLLFKHDSKIVKTMSYGKNEQKGVVIIYEPLKAIPSMQSRPDFIKELLSLDLRELR
ncbi:hypothetical protein SanaruYs_11370 [Chryseotalea sanaruensis]|uniref:Uncharacterized protein n=1 Tax=Chryseotalea sanaruensis TaxID=2482724 RepID=A0A401U7P9_9BACT|nr:hypothetical protein [Chryseotalea sanaruensis]GCC50918.1 hypothetical protein SanaruYs_11370 [Chryseotalea sanaruensis]